MSTLLPSFIVFLELKQAKFFWSVLLIFGKTEAFLFHFLYSSCLSLTHSVFHRLYIILYIWDAVFSMCGTNFHNGGAYNRTVGLGSHFLCLLGVEMPKPTAHGMSFASFTSFTIAPISVVIRVLVPVTPREETQYTKPFASFAIRVIRSWDVGAIREISSRPYCLQTTSNSSFSSKGTSGRISPSIPISAAFLMKRSVP